MSLIETQDNYFRGYAPEATDERGRMVTREKIRQFEEALAQQPRVEIRETHRFGGGIYAREIFIPKGTCLTGKIHKTEHINIISQGDISVLTEDGMKRIQAPCTIVSAPGMKRVGYAHEDTVWTTIHATTETDLEKLEAIFIAEDYADVSRLTRPALTLKGQ